MDRDQRHRLGGGGIAKPLHDPRLGQAHAALRPGLFRLHQLAVLGAQRRVPGDLPFLVRALVDRHDPPALGRLAEDAEDLVRVGADLADQPRLILVILAPDLVDAGKDTVAFSDRGIGLARLEKDARFRCLALPFQRAGELIAVAVGRQDHQDRNGGQLFGVAVGLAAAFQRACTLKLFQHTLQLDPVRALDPEGLGDVALGGQAGIVGDPVEDFGF